MSDLKPYLVFGEEKRMECRAKESNKVSRRGKPSIEWYKDGKKQYYCYGYIDKMTDELLPECKECRIHVYKAQDNLDKYNRRAEDRTSMRLIDANAMANSLMDLQKVDYLRIHPGGTSDNILTGQKTE